jgi:hypothetical protein
MPDRFKTARVNVNIGAKGDVLVLAGESRLILQDANRQWLLDHPPPPRELGETPQ